MTETPETPCPAEPDKSVAQSATSAEAEIRQREQDEIARKQAMIDAYNADAPRRLRNERRRRASGQVARGVNFNVFDLDDHSD